MKKVSLSIRIESRRGYFYSPVENQPNRIAAPHNDIRRFRHNECVYKGRADALIRSLVVVVIKLPGGNSNKASGLAAQLAAVRVSVWKTLNFRGVRCSFFISSS